VTNTRMTLRLSIIAAAAVAMAAPSAAQAQGSQPNYEELEKFMEVYGRIKANYVRQVTDKELVKGAIDGMLNALDPHSSYAETSDYDDLEVISTWSFPMANFTAFERSFDNSRTRRTAAASRSRSNSMLLSFDFGITRS